MECAMDVHKLCICLFWLCPVVENFWLCVLARLTELSNETKKIWTWLLPSVEHCFKKNKKKNKTPPQTFSCFALDKPCKWSYWSRRFIFNSNIKIIILVLTVAARLLGAGQQMLAIAVSKRRKLLEEKRNILKISTQYTIHSEMTWLTENLLIACTLQQNLKCMNVLYNECQCCKENYASLISLCQWLCSPSRLESRSWSSWKCSSQALITAALSIVKVST